jgi:Spy/CpxP family protein refolding chaperone
MKRNTIILAAVAVLALAAVPFVYAEGHHGHMGSHGFGGGMMFGRLAMAKAALGLTDAQVDQIKAIGAELKAQNQPYKEQLRGGFAGVAQALVNNPNDLTTAQTLLDQQEQAERTMKSNALAAASKALNVLTPEQRAKVGTFIANRIAKHHTH